MKFKESGAVAVAKVNAAGTALLYSTVFGGSQYDYSSAIGVDADGAAYVTGYTSSPNFPITAGAFQQQLPPIFDLYVTSAFVTKLNPAGTALVYSTYLGGSSATRGNGIAVDASGNAYVAGGTAYGTQTAQTAFVTKLNSTGTELVYSTSFDGAEANAIALDAQGNAQVTGLTFGGLPVYHAFQPGFYPRLLATYTASGDTTYGWATCSDGFVAGLDQSGLILLYSTYLNGYQQEQQVSGLAIAVDEQGNTYAGGFGALALAATNPLSNDGGAFVVKLRQAGAPPFFTRQSITNGASFASGLVESGGLASIFAAGLTGISGIVQATGYPLPTELAGVQVKIDGLPAPLLAVSDQGGSQQVNLQVPFGADEWVLDVEVSQNGLTAWVPRVDTQSTAPGLFTLDGIYGAIEHGTDYSLVTPQSPAQPGEIVVLYGTGLGPVTPAVAGGVPAPAAVSSTVRIPTVAVGGQAANVEFSGLTPGLIGVYQINVRVPQNASSGDQDVVVSFPPYKVCCTGGGSAQSYITVVVDSEPVKLPVR